MRMLSKFFATVAVVAMTCSSVSHAQTPKDIFVIATQLDEYITLDPAESVEISPMEYVTNTYDLLVRGDFRDTSKFNGDVAQSWSVSPDGITFIFNLRPALKFHSGNALTAEDVAWSIQRAVLLGKGPAGVLARIGLDKANVVANVKAINDLTVSVTTDRKYAPSFVLNVLGSWPASVVDKKLLLSHVQGNDYGNGWLKTNEAGSGPYELVKWTPSQNIVLKRFDGYRSPLEMKRIVLRHVPEAATQRLLLESGDVDAAYNLSPDDLVAIEKSGKAKVTAVPQGTLLYLGLNRKNPILAKAEVQQALEWLVDYESIQRNLLKTTYEVHQTFVPDGFFGALNENPYHLDVAKAKTLLAKAGVPSGFEVTMDVRNAYPYTQIAQAIQANFALAGVKLTLISGDNKQTLSKYRARQHDIYLGEWSADYTDPYTMASGFARNPGVNDAPTTSLAWRNNWNIPELTKETDAALTEPSSDRRQALYQKMQKEVLADSPFVIMFQKISLVATRPGVSGLEVGPTNGLVSYRKLRKQ
ncbi:ABC transporter substrate-binding protein [Paraburkholderia caribensis]|uniref:Extracellular solute-binding protein family 5 n=2 Tax=Paraburkholderia TaxID=1822464 RepID=B2JY50_PARP8|nr:extracellular solute-binding protein family 5 [Paraburkholderia phymatum STM815]PTB24582.1 ABC transporter substrate-binding protein [Paraburkholderia caribensis]